jgi:guanine deaminase
MKAIRAAILRFADDGSAVYEEDGLLVLGPDAGGRQVVRAVGPYAQLADRFPGVAVEHLPGRIVAPGFIDLHIHFPQTDVIGSPAAGLLPWLEDYTFPHESRFADPAHSDAMATVFLDELARHGVTTALAFCTSHPGSVDSLMQESQRRGMRMIAGKVLQDRHSPDGVRDETEQSLVDTEALIQRWHGTDRLGYAITPRFAPSCSEA